MIKEGIKREDLNLIQYREAIREGNIIAGQELIIELDNLIRDLDKDEYIYDTTEFNRRLHFMENCIRLTKSPYYGKQMKLMLFQKAWLECLYSFKIYDEFLGKWINRFNETVFLLGRKNTKSETSSAISTTDFIMGGEGRDIILSSNTDDQANILYDAVNLMRQLIDPDQQDTWQNRRGLKCKLNNNKISKISEKTKNKEGRNIDLAVIDESNEMADNTLYKSIQQSCGVKEEYLIIIITTEGFIDDGFLSKKLEFCRDVIYGRDDTMAGKRLLPWLYTQDSEAEVFETDENGISRMWEKSNPTIGQVKKWSYLREQVELARRSKADRPMVLCKDFNIHQSNSQAWLLPEDYNYHTEPFDLEDFRDSYGIAGVDLAETTDLCSCKILLFKKGRKEQYVLSHYWIPESKLEDSDDRQAGADYLKWAGDEYMTIVDGNYVDSSVVADWIFELEKKYNIRMLKVGYDKRFSNDFIHKMEYYGYSEKTKDPDLVMILQSPEVLHRANRLVEENLKGRFIIGLNPIDKWCLGNAALKINEKGQSLVVKANNQSSRRIDGAVALVIATETYIRYRKELESWLN